MFLVGCFCRRWTMWFLFIISLRKFYLKQYGLFYCSFCKPFACLVLNKQRGDCFSWFWWLTLVLLVWFEAKLSNEAEQWASLQDVCSINTENVLITQSSSRCCPLYFFSLFLVYITATADWKHRLNCFLSIFGGTLSLSFWSNTVEELFLISESICPCLKLL